MMMLRFGTGADLSSNASPIPVFSQSMQRFVSGQLGLPSIHFMSVIVKVRRKATESSLMEKSNDGYILTVTGARSPTACASLLPVSQIQVISRLRPTVMLVEHQVRGDECTCVTLDE
jgi:hypothetical protein